MSNDYRKSVKKLVQLNCGQSSTTQAIWAHIESLMYTVTLDKDLLVQEIEKALSGQDVSDKNALKRVLEAVFGVFGVNIIPKDICERIGVDSIRQEQRMIMIDENRAKAVAPVITNVVSELEKTGTMHAQRAGQMEKLLQEANRTADKLRQERDELLKDQERKEKNLFRAVQRILAQHPDMRPAGEDESDALLMYLEDLNLTWSWDDKEYPEDFTTYVISDASQVGVRMPCIYRNDAPVQKGLKYVLDI